MVAPAISDHGLCGHESGLMVPRSPGAPMAALKKQSWLPCRLRYIGFRIKMAAAGIGTQSAARQEE
jgi:hypothetical protein